VAFLTSRTTRVVALVALVASLSACGLPRSGPSKREVFAGSVLKEGDAFVITVNDRVTAATSINNELGFSSAFLNAGEIGSDTIAPGDVLSLTIWENVDDGLLAGAGANATVTFSKCATHPRAEQGQGRTGYR